MSNAYSLSYNIISKDRKQLYSDLSLRVLFLSNLITIMWALIEGWSVGMVMWSYWSHSVSIGILWFFKILCLKDFSTKGVELPTGKPAPTTSGKIQCALFFLLFFAFALYIYSGGLGIVFPTIKRAEILPIAAVFFVCQCFSFFYNRKWKVEQKPNIGNMMLFPYIRILPMHFSFLLSGFVIYIIGGTFSSKFVLVIFMLFKTLTDVFMHVVEHIGFGD